MTPPLLEIRNVTRRFGDFTAVDNVSLTINTGEFFTLLGPSGCGKTTLLRMLAGFDQPDSGEIRLNGQDLAGVEPEKRPVHTVFQSYALFPHMSVAQNIAFPLKMAGVAKSEIDARVEQALKDVRLADKGGRMPTQLSGGQRQRVAIARALVNRPRLLLLDEPLSALDAKLREEMQIELINLQKDVGITFVYVTHDQGEALALSHRIAVMNQGRVEQLDAPETIYSFPRSRFVADFIGQCNLLDATVEAVDGERVRIDLRGPGEGGRHRVGEQQAGQGGDQGVAEGFDEQLQVHPALGEPGVVLHAEVVDGLPVLAVHPGRQAAVVAGKAERGEQHDQRRNQEEEQQIRLRRPDQQPLAEVLSHRLRP